MVGRKQAKNWHKSARAENGRRNRREEMLKIFGCCATTPGTEAQHSGQAGSFLPVAVEPAGTASAVSACSPECRALQSVGPRHLGSVLRPFLFPAESGIALLILQHFTGSYMAFASHVRQRQLEVHHRSSLMVTVSPCVSPLLSSPLVHHVVLDQSDSKTLPAHFSDHQLQFGLFRTEN